MAVFDLMSQSWPQWRMNEGWELVNFSVTLWPFNPDKQQHNSPPAFLQAAHGKKKNGFGNYFP